VKIRAFGLLAVVAVPLAVSASRTPAQHGSVVLGLASGITAGSSTTLLRRRTRTSGCTLGVLPDRRCSPGAYDRTRPKAVLCDTSFHTGSVRNVPDSEKHAVEVEYGLEPKPYGSSLEIDHIVSLELGGSNDIANLYPELAPQYHDKDKLENRVHALVCSGAMSLHTAQRRIAQDWRSLYDDVFG
jgi:hypothetical protein